MQWFGNCTGHAQNLKDGDGVLHFEADDFAVISLS